MLLLALSCLSLRAQKAWSEGDLERAMRLAERQLERDPEDLEALLVKGRSLARQGDCEAALPPLERVDELALEGSWQSGWSRVVQGACHEELGAPVRALELYRSVPESERHHADDSARRREGPLQLEAELATWQEFSSPHLKVYLSPRLSEIDPEGWVAGRERAYEAIVDFAGREPRLPIEIVVWQDDEDAGRYLSRQLGWAEVERGRIHTRWNQTRGHELAHVVLGQTWPREHSTPLINEGVAVYLDQRRGDRFERARTWLDEDGVEAVDLVALWTAEERDELVYPVGGAWVERLVELGGQERFMELLVDQRYERAQELYGEELQTWIEDFEAELR